MEYILSLLIISIISAFVGFGFKRMQDFDMIFYWYGNMLNYLANKNKFLYYITKPLGRCIICNTTWIGMFLAFMFFRDLPLLFISICIVGVASAGIVVLISNKYEIMQNAL